MIWRMIHPQATYEMLGYIPMFVSDSDPRSAREQFDANYRYCLWHADKDFDMKMRPNGDLSHTGDPPIRLLAETKLRDEVIRFYEHEWIVILQPDGSFEISRMD